mmetsp:Transcript_35274/g.88452  ORF Transcript_35274/g.88452 Transcript_35274/m.88452 type:complete len:321 (+) Transcript_35274:195-1157(+)
MAGADGSGAPAPFEAYADPYLLGVTAAATIAYQAIFFVVTAVCRTDRITDLAGGTNFVLLAGLTLGLGARPPSVRQAVLTGMVAAWGLRLSGFLFLRILQWGQDRRFDAQRRSLPRLAVFWSLQALWVWTVSLPLTFANSPPALPAPLGALDYVGWVAWAVGASLEAVADQQKLAFKKAQENRGRWCDAGVWGWSRHPNYCGEIVLWWGVYLSALPSLVGPMHSAVLGPLLITALLLFLSGIPLLEASADGRHGDDRGYRDYKASTSPLLPLPPACWAPLPRWVKAALFEYPMYSKLSNSTIDVSLSADEEESQPGSSSA